MIYVTSRKALVSVIRKKVDSLCKPDYILV